MGENIITAEQKRLCFDLSKEDDNNSEHEICFIKNEVRQLMSKYKHKHDI